MLDVMKELPATLVLRLFDFNTLAVRAFEMASDERLADAGPLALMIVAVGLIPVMMLRGVKNPKHKNGRVNERVIKPEQCLHRISCHRLSTSRVLR